MPECNSSFLKDLKSLDKKLSTKFNGEHWVVTYERPYGEPVNVYRVKGDNGGYRQPDNRDLAVIKGGDLAEGDKPEIRLKKLAYMSEKMREEARRKARENIRDLTKDDRHYLASRIGQLTNQGKCNSAFRRIKTKPSKNTVRVIP
jgi:mRNA-degrading endonuclease RelE of RelBE toxin-antitoxin system